HLDATTDVQMQVRLTHDQPGQLGFECEHISLESISHLRRLVECGPGKVLAGLNKRCADGVSTANLNTPDAFAAARAALA
ncbi:hypothetical protein L9Z73_29525, partial [Pseudomonas sp. TNT11]|nr:hypothetical protein [Pseudomonas emilianonis]